MALDLGISSWTLEEIHVFHLRAPMYYMYPMYVSQVCMQWFPISGHVKLYLTCMHVRSMQFVFAVSVLFIVKTAFSGQVFLVHWMNKWIFMYRTCHIHVVSWQFTTLLLGEIGHQFVKAPLAAAISPYLILPTQPTHAWNDRDELRHQELCALLFLTSAWVL